MYPVSQDFKTNIKTLARELRGKIVVGGSIEIMDEDDLQSLTFERGSQNSIKLIGNTISQKATINILNPEGLHAFEFGQDIVCYFGPMVDGDPEYVPYPAVFIEDIKTDDVSKIVTLTAYDIMRRFDNYVIGDLAVDYPLTLREYAHAVCNLCGVTLSSESFYHEDLVLDAPPNLNGTETCREVIGWIAECALANAVIDRSNELAFVSIINTEPVDTIDGEGYFEFLRKPMYGPINTLVLDRQPQNDVVYREDAEAVALDGPKKLIITDNPFLDDKREDVINGMLEAVNGLFFYPYTLNWCGDPSIDLYDCLSIQDIDDNYYPVIYAAETLEYDGGIKSISDVAAPSEADVQTKKGSRIKDVLRRTELEVDKVNGKITSLVEENLDTRSLIEQTASQIRSEVASGYVDTATGEAITERVSRIEQTAEQISQKIIHSSGGNLLFGTAAEALDDWTVTGMVSIIRSNELSSGKNFVIEDGSLSQSIRLVIGKTYAYYLKYKLSGGTAKVTIDTEIGLDITTEWTEITGTFTAQNETGIYKAEVSGGTLQIGDMTIVEGNFIDTWQQSQNEIITDDMTFDRRGLHIRKSDSPLETNITHDEVRIKNKNTGADIAYFDTVGASFGETTVKEKLAVRPANTNSGALVIIPQGNGHVFFVIND